MKSGRRNWVVNISTDDNDPAVFGPYTRARAQELAERFGELVTAERYGGFICATAYPIDNPGIRAMVAEFGL